MFENNSLYLKTLMTLIAEWLEVLAGATHNCVSRHA